EGLRGFRDVIAETEALGDATAQGAKAARDVFAATPPSANQTYDRVEPRVEPEGLRPPMRPPPRPIEPPRAPPPHCAKAAASISPSSPCNFPSRIRGSPPPSPAAPTATSAT
ncbi:MAG: hypothetical protein ABR585_14610, partial [Gemmatimonadaceae bacterium]